MRDKGICLAGPSGGASVWCEIYTLICGSSFDMISELAVTRCPAPPAIILNQLTEAEDLRVMFGLDEQTGRRKRHFHHFPSSQGSF